MAISIWISLLLCDSYLYNSWAKITLKPENMTYKNWPKEIKEMKYFRLNRPKLSILLCMWYFKTDFQGFIRRNDYGLVSCDLQSKEHCSLLDLRRTGPAASILGDDNVLEMADPNIQLFGIVETSYLNLSC